MKNRINKLLALFIIVLFMFSCKSNKNIINKPIGQDLFNIISVEELEYILQQGLNTNHLDGYFTEKERKEGIVIVINKFIEPHYKSFDLKKFGQKVRFEKHNMIYDNLNEKFLDIRKGAFTKDSLTININLRSKFNAMFVGFVKKDKGWEKTTKNMSDDAKNLSTVHFMDDKENCLAHKILKKKYPEKYYYLRDCGNFDFEN